MHATTALLRRCNSVCGVHPKSQHNAREHEASIANRSADKEDPRHTRDRRVWFSLEHVPRSAQQLTATACAGHHTIGICEGTKGYKAYLREEIRVIVTQHVKNIDTLSDAQNTQLKHETNNEDRDVTARD